MNPFDIGTRKIVFPPSLRNLKSKPFPHKPTQPLSARDTGSCGGLTPGQKLWKLVFYVGEDKSLPVTFDLAGQMLFGRSDSSQAFRPDFDLNYFGGQDAGVSRRHALLFADRDGLYIRDLDSTNG